MTEAHGTTFGINDFVRRQTADSPFSHFEGDWDYVLDIAIDNFDRRKTAYRDGVINIPVPPQGFFSPVVKLAEGMEITGEYKPRRKGETPRLNIRAKGGKTPAVAVELDFYRKDVLEESGDNSTAAEWELVNVRAMAFEDEPMNPATLMHNHFGSDGGTDTKMSPFEFQAALRESFEFWKDKAMVDG
jgi:hypothetical protein